jgi:hypothetical protein
MTDYRSLSADELWATLGQADRTVDLDLIRACLGRREELTPALLTSLEDGPDLGWEDDDPRWFLESMPGSCSALTAGRRPCRFSVVCSVSS